MVEGADSSLGDDTGPDGSSEAEMLFTVLRGMWTKPSKKQRKNNEEFAKSTTTVTNRSQRRKTPRKNEENGRQKPARREKLNAPRNHMIDVASHRACACQRLLT